MNSSQLRAILMILAACLASACISPAGEWSYEEIGRVKSPDSIVDAVLVRGNGGATTSFSFSVFIVPAGTKFENDSTFFKSSVFTADHVDGLQLRWMEPKLLGIQYKEARIFQFRNNWNRQEVQEFHYVVEIKLLPPT